MSGIEAARVKHVMEHNRLGVMGHYYNGMLDIHSDLTQQCATFGGHIEIVEVDELAQLCEEISPAQIAARVEEFGRAFEVQSDCPSEELARAARTSVALDALVEAHDLGSLAYYYMGRGDNENAISSIILGTSLLTARGVPCAGELEIKNAQAMKIMDAFGVGGSFTEYYALDFNDDVVLMGHDGPGHIAIAQGKTKVRPLSVYHGKIGRGLAVEMTVKHGPVDAAFGRGNARWRFEIAVRARRIGRWADFRNRQYQQSLPFFDWRAQLRQRMELSWPRAPLRGRRRTYRREAGKAGGAAGN